MEVLKKILWYLNPRRKHDPDQPSSINLKLMHGINKISIFLFLAAVIIYLLSKFVF